MLKRMAAICLLVSAPVAALAQSAERELTFELDATVTAVEAEERTVSMM